MNAENIAAVIGLLAFIASDYAKVLTGTICNKGRSNTASAGDREHSGGPSWVEGSVDMAVGIGPLRSTLRPRRFHFQLASFKQREREGHCRWSSPRLQPANRRRSKGAIHKINAVEEASPDIGV